METRKFPTGLFIVVGAVALSVGLIVAAGAVPARKFSDLTDRQVALICTTDMATRFHIHAHLKIVIDGQERVVPQGIGIKADCMNSIHTHDASGRIHIEAPEKRDFTLADLFAVWGQPFSKDGILEAKTDATHAVTVTVNGKPVESFEDTVMHDDDDIVIAYGGILKP